MSEQAILRRLKTVDRLRELCLALMKAKKAPALKMSTVSNIEYEPSKSQTGNK